MALKMAKGTALPDAMSETLNTAADAVTRKQIKNVQRRLHVRTKYTTNSMKSGRAKPYYALNKAMGRNIDRMYSRAGTFSDYLWLQENDQTVEGINSGPVPIPTTKARTSDSIMKAIRKKYRLSANQNLDIGEIGSEHRQFIGTPKGGGRPKGLYERRNNNKRLVMIRNLEKRKVNIKGVHFHRDAVRQYGTPQYIESKFNRIAIRILRRKGLSG
jgi:hypothetical protein